MEQTAILTRTYRTANFRAEVTWRDDMVAAIYIYTDTAGRGESMLVVKNSFGADSNLSDLLRLIEHVISDTER